MRKVLKVLIILIALVLVFGIGFILTLQVFEYNPAPEVPLTVENNSENSLVNQVPENQTIKIMTFNIGYASLSETEDFAMDGGSKGHMDSKDGVESNLAGISEILSLADADIYLLQEVDEDSHRSFNTEQYSLFQELLPMASTLGYNYRCIFVPFPFDFSQMMGKVNSGIATFSSFHVEEAVRYQLPGSFSWPIRLANLKRCMVVSRIHVAGEEKELVIINVHLSAYDDGEMRRQETDALKTFLAEESQKGNYVVVGGDFNQTFPDAVTITTTDAGETYDYLYELKDPDFWQAFPLQGEWFEENGFQFAIDLNTPTCRLLHQPLDTENSENNQYYSIDGFILSSNILLESVETLDEGFRYSDHNPVLLEIRLVP
jgi:endonuclease/exonuclease/phosphatase family metal-dependent hydrolase